MMLPVAAPKVIALLLLVQAEHWPQAPAASVMAAQIEKETCITLTHPSCFSPRAELKTARENGVGLGQITRAYNADGSIRFDKQAELRAQHAALKHWKWEQRYDPRLQLTALVLMDRTGYQRFAPLAATPTDAWSFTLAGYNGGDGAVQKDRLLCQKRPDCDPRRWFGHVELHSVKSRVKWRGYGQSTYDINRGYVRRVIDRAPAYANFWKDRG